MARPRTEARAVLGAGLAALALVGACGGTGSAADTTAVPATAVPSTTAAPEGPRRLELPRPDWLAASDEAVYVRLDGGSVRRLDPATGETVASVDVGGDLCQGLGVAFGSVWTCSGTDVVRLGPDLEGVEATLPVGKAAEQGSLVGGFGRLWVLTGDGSALVGIDPGTNQPGTPIALGVRGTDLAVDDEHVWVVSGPDDALVRIDPVALAVDGRADGLADARTVDATVDLWVGTAGGTVRIDRATLSVDRTIDASPGRTGSLAADGDDLWIRATDPLLTRVDRTDGAVLDRIDDEVTSGGDVLVAFDAVWATAYDDATLVRIPLDP